jgi:hypothetical protein
VITRIGRQKPSLRHCLAVRHMFASNTLLCAVTAVVVTSEGFKRPGFDCQQRRDIFLVSTQSHIQWVPGSKAAGA